MTPRELVWALAASFLSHWLGYFIGWNVGYEKAYRMAVQAMRETSGCVAQKTMDTVNSREGA